MSDNVAGLHGPTVDDILDKLCEARAAGNLTTIMVVTLDSDLFVSFAFSQMTNERSIWMADMLMQKARREQ